MATQQENVEVKDPTFGLNNFHEPKILSVKETFVRNMLLILFGKPGFYPSQPQLGMNIGQYIYDFEGEIDTNEIKTELVRQCGDFLPEVEANNFDVYFLEKNDRRYLLFSLPLIVDDKTMNMALGVTTSVNGVLIYNFIENKRQLI